MLRPADPFQREFDSRPEDEDEVEFGIHIVDGLRVLGDALGDDRDESKSKHGEQRRGPKTDYDPTDAIRSNRWAGGRGDPAKGRNRGNEHVVAPVLERCQRAKMLLDI